MTRAARRFVPAYVCRLAMPLLGALVWTSTAHAAATVRTVALTGQPAPGSPVIGRGPNFFALGPPILNDAGQTAFLAFLDGWQPGTAYDGLWSEGAGSLAPVARTGDQAPGAPNGVKFIGFRRPVLNEAGHTAFHGVLTGASEASDYGIWSQASGTLTAVALEGSPAAGTPANVNFGSPFPSIPSFFAVLNNAGQTAFWAGLSGAGVIAENDFGIWSQGASGLNLVAREGQPAPGANSGAIFHAMGQPVLNHAGRVAFTSRLVGSGVDATNDYGIWSDRTGSLTMVARSGNPAPGTSDGVNFKLSQTTFVVLNNAGQTAFNARLAGVGVDATNDQGIWSEGSGSMTLVARSGSQAVGAPAGAKYGEFIYAVLNEAGQTAFRALTSGGIGIWSEGSGSLALVALGGTQAPGAPSGVNFTSVANRMNNPILNNAGQTAFSSFLAGNGVNSSNSEGIWATDPHGALQLIVRTGDSLEVAPGDFRTISDVDLENFFPTGNGDGHPSGFNNKGQLAFWAAFTNDSQGVFVSNLVAVPEPSTPLLLAAAATVVGAARRPPRRLRHSRPLHRPADARP